ncbi:indolepyruvate oxidoreductase subunit beta [bacterium]|nr:indolepyruvate oxidoreductase subunit beta [bacterium]
MNETKNVLIVGVGGQGVLLATELLSTVTMEAGYDVKKSEVHGMAQRGGVVSSHVRFGDNVFSPLIPDGEADVILAFEQAEAQRWIHYLKDNGTIAINKYKLVPPIASMKGFNYPEDPIAVVRKRTKNVTLIDAVQIAKDLGNPRLVNTILLGVLSTSLEISEDIWTRVIRERVPKGTEELNVKAFLAGRAYR